MRSARPRTTTRSLGRRGLLGLALLATVGLVGACSKDATTTAGGAKVAITATDSSCEVAQTTVTAGARTFTVTNKGNDVTEVYVYGDDGKKILSEVENIGAGTSRDLNVTLPAGTYEIACKPGQKGDGIRTKLTVTGDGGQGTVVSKIDREVEFSGKDNTYEGLANFSATAGQTVEFKLKNIDATEEHEFELFAPNGDSLGEIAEIKPGETGEMVATLAVPGTYTYKCGHNNHDQHGMKGSFVVL